MGKHGTEELKTELLPKVASGEWFVGISSTEPGGGSDVANIQTTAVRKDDKFILNGEKVYISGVQETREQRGGGHITLFRTDPDAGHRGMTFAYVPANLPGITATLFDDIWRGGLSTGGLAFKDVKTSTETVDGKPVLVIEGMIVAQSRKSVELPRLRFSVRDTHETEIYAWNAVLEQAALKPGENVWFRTRLAAPPPEGRRIGVRFFNRQDLAAGNGA